MTAERTDMGAAGRNDTSVQGLPVIVEYHPPPPDPDYKEPPEFSEYPPDPELALVSVKMAKELYIGLGKVAQLRKTTVPQMLVDLAYQELPRYLEQVDATQKAKNLPSLFR